MNADDFPAAGRKEIDIISGPTNWQVLRGGQITERDGLACRSALPMSAACPPPATHLSQSIIEESPLFATTCTAPPN